MSNEDWFTLEAYITTDSLYSEPMAMVSASWKALHNLLKKLFCLQMTFKPRLLHEINTLPDISFHKFRGSEKYNCRPCIIELFKH